MDLTVCRLLWAGTSRVRRRSGDPIFLLLSAFHLDSPAGTRAPQYSYPSLLVQNGAGRLDAACIDNRQSSDCPKEPSALRNASGGHF